jgi:hypothetical protein
MGEMTIPRPRSQTAWVVGLILFVVAFCILAIMDLFRGDAVLASALWLGFVALLVWVHARDAGGLRSYALDTIAAAYGRHYAQATDGGGPSGYLRFGYDLGRHRFVRRTFPLGAVRSVEWHFGQGTSMAGRDMNDWTVAVWYLHGDEAKDEQMRKWSARPGEEPYVIGPHRPKQETEALGQELVALLRSAGIPLVPGQDDQAFVRGLQKMG